MNELLKTMNDHIDFLNEIIYIDGNDNKDLENELVALVYAKKFFNAVEWEREYKPTYAKMFFKHYEALSWKGAFINRVSRKMESTISSLI